MKMKFGKIFGLILAGVIFVLTTGCSKSPFEKLQAATEGKYFDSKETDGKVLFVPLRTNVKVIKETVDDPKMTFLSYVGSVSLNLGPVSVTIDADKMAEGLPGYCIGAFEQRTAEERNICNQLFALALKSEAGKDGKSVDFVDYFPSKHDAELIALSDKIGKLLIAKKLDAAETAIAKLGKNFRGTDRAGIAEWEADVYRAYALALRGDGEKAKRIIEQRFLNKNLFNFLLNGRRPAFDARKKEMIILAHFVAPKSSIFLEIETITSKAMYTQIYIKNNPSAKKLEMICAGCIYDTVIAYNKKIKSLGGGGEYVPMD